MADSFILTHDPLGGWPLEPRPPRSPARDIIAEVALEHGFQPADLTGPSLKHAHCNARRIAIQRIRAELCYSRPRIARLFNRHPNSVLWACRGGRPGQPRKRREAQHAA